MPANELPKFTTIKYVTSNGENCTATKNNGVVTIQGDKNGIRQMPLDEFMQDFIRDQSKKTLERTPNKDTVSFSGKYKEKSIYDNLKVSNGFLGLGKRTITGNMGGCEVKFKMDTNFWGSKVKLNGTIDGRSVNLTLKNGNIEGDLANQDRKLVPYIKMLMMDKLSYDEQCAVAAAMV